MVFGDQWPAFRTRHTLVVLGDRVLHMIRPRWPGRVSVREFPPAVSDARSRRAPIDLLDDALRGLQLPGAVDVALGTVWTRTELIALGAKAVSRDEERRIAEMAAQQLQTQQADKTSRLVTRSTRLPGHLLVAAIPETARIGLVEGLARRNVVVTSIQPLFLWLSRQKPTRFRQRDGWVVLSEPGVVSIAHVTGGEIDSHRTYRADRERIDIGTLLLRQAAASGRPPEAPEIMTISTARPAVPAAWTPGALFRDFPN